MCVCVRVCVQTSLLEAAFKILAYAAFFFFLFDGTRKEGSCFLTEQRNVMYYLAYVYLLC